MIGPFVLATIILQAVDRGGRRSEASGLESPERSECQPFRWVPGIRSCLSHRTCIRTRTGLCEGKGPDFVTPDGEMRATFDSAQEVYDQSYRSRPNLDYRLPIDELLVIELKGDSTQSERLQEACSQFPIRLSRNSKYASSLRAALL